MYTCAHQYMWICGERIFNLYLYVYIMYIFIHILKYANNCAMTLELAVNLFLFFPLQFWF